MLGLSDPALLAGGSAFLLLFSVRLALQALLRSLPLSQEETAPRIAAGLSALLIVGSAQWLGAEPGLFCLVCYLLADTAGAAFFGPWLRAEILVHHAVTAACAIMTLSVLKGSAEAVAIAVPCSITLLMMELVNPFLHLLWILHKEKAAAGLAAWLLAPLAAATVALYAYLRVWGCCSVALTVWHCDWAVLGRWAPGIMGMIAALMGMQLWWFYLLCKMVLRAAQGSKSAAPVPVREKR
jgi:hypothetical protein